jgi:hypothetical protein
MTVRTHPAHPAHPARSGRAFPLSSAAVSTPVRLRFLVGLLVAACLAWGAVAAWTVIQHAAAARQAVATSEPLSLDAQDMYQSLSDADVTAGGAFLAGPREPLAARQRYAADIGRAAADLTALRTAAASQPARTVRQVAAISAGLPLYTGYIAEARTDYALGYQLTGGSFMQVAAEEMHLTLLPAAHGLYDAQNSALRAASARASGLPWIIVVLLGALVIAAGLYRTQRWLWRRTHRLVNYGLLGASAVLLVAAVWLAVAFVVARADLTGGTGRGSDPAEALAQAGIAAQQARGDQLLNLISRSGDAPFEQDYRAVRAQLGPGPGSLLAAAARSAPGGAGARWAAAAARQAGSWYTVNDQAYRLDAQAHYAAETQLVIGAGASGSAGQFTGLENDLHRGIAADQRIFRRRATAGQDAFAGLTAGVIVAALLMAAGCGWGLDRRLAEYR